MMDKEELQEFRKRIKEKELQERGGFWYGTTDALLSLLAWRDGVYISLNGTIYVRRLEGEHWAVGDEDESAEHEELFDHPATAIERFLQRIREYDHMPKKEGL
jgi:hypothetical protein